MKIHLAGFNVDTAVLRELEERSGKRTDITPEVISAAYARISRDPRAIADIRADARAEVERARGSNTTIIFRMGHHSVAEHAVFNLDVVGLSRYAMEELEKFRLVSYTEKSQRYITLDRDFVVPAEIQGTALEKAFTDTVRVQNEAYHELFALLKDHVFEKHADLAADPKKHNLLEGWAKEDARYVTSLATESQAGLTVNARNLELMLRRFASHPLAEIRELGRGIYEQIHTVAPSIVIFHNANDRDQKTYPGLAKAAKPFLKKAAGGKKAAGDVELVDYSKDGDATVGAALLSAVSRLDFAACRARAKKLPKKDLEKLFKAAWKNLQFYDSMLREFEFVNLTYSIVLSAACFGQLKRHRMSTITAQAYDPALGVTIPRAIKEIGREKQFTDIVKLTNRVYAAIKKSAPLAAPYILTNAHRKRVLMRVNAREMYHIARLREDAHAQWDIRNVSSGMSALAKKAMPLVFGLVGGKDRYNETYRKVFGVLPKVTQAELPGARTLK